MITEEKLQDVAERAEFAFWEEVAKNYPEIETGDVEPLSAFNFSKHCEDMIRNWLEDNKG